MGLYEEIIELRFRFIKELEVLILDSLIEKLKVELK
jgi:hypothetical protein